MKLIFKLKDFAILVESHKELMINHMMKHYIIYMYAFIFIHVLYMIMYACVYMYKYIYITLPTKVRLVKDMVFPVVRYGCESWTVKKAECRRIDALNCGVGEDS